jgi:hypothetical protein
VEAGIIVIGRGLVQTERHVEPRPNPFASIDSTGLERRHDLAPRKRHRHGAQPPEHLRARPGHAVPQSLEGLRRGDLVVEPSTHLGTCVGAEKRLDVELAAELVPQLLAAAVMNPCEQLVCGKAEGHRRIELKRWGFLVEIPFVRMEHVGHAGAYGIEGFERTHQRADRKDLDFDTAGGRNADRLREADCAGVKAGRTFGPVGHHLQLSNSLRDRGRGKARRYTANQ